MLYSLGWASSDEEVNQSPFRNSRGRELVCYVLRTQIGSGESCFKCEGLLIRCSTLLPMLLVTSILVSTQYIQPVSHHKIHSPRRDRSCPRANNHGLKIEKTPTKNDCMALPVLMNQFEVVRSADLSRRVIFRDGASFVDISSICWRPPIPLKISTFSLTSLHYVPVFFL